MDGKMRRHLSFICQEERVAATLDIATGKTGIFIVSGGNEVRAGAHRGQALLAQRLAMDGVPVFRFDRRGVGDSSGENLGFEQSGEDITAALACFRAETEVERIVAFGNCDAATALAMHDLPDPPDALILSNPWVIEGDGNAHSPKQLRQRYWGKLTDPRAIWQFLNSELDIKKLGKGLKTAASSSSEFSVLAARMGSGLSGFAGDIHLLIAKRDRTAQIFAEKLETPALAALRTSPRCHVHTYDSASHSYAGEADKEWLYTQIKKIVRTIER